MGFIRPYLPLIGVFVLVVTALFTAHWWLIGRNKGLGGERLFPRQLVMLTLTVVGVVCIAFALPVSEGSRNQILALMGLLISGIFAFSSGTFFANLTAGIMLRVTKPFHTGDFIRVGEHFGRVVERGLLDTELQTEKRELTAIPNTFLITHPVSVTRSSGTIISADLSLGYDVPPTQVESILMDAAEQCGLEDPFVHILELRDFAVEYRINGMLKDVKNILTARSNLRRRVLDSLHGNGIEIMSPTYMVQRRLPDDAKILPKSAAVRSAKVETAPEDLVFDKAEKAEQLEKLRQDLVIQIEEAQKAAEGASEPRKKQIQETLAKLQRRLEGIEKR